MNNHPSFGRGPADDDSEDEAFIRAVAARQAAALGRPVPVDNDPATVRRGLASDRDVMMMAVAVLHRSGCGATVPDVLDAVLAGQPPTAAFDLPPGVAGVILERTPDRHAPDVFDALDAELQRFAARALANPHIAANLRSYPPTASTPPRVPGSRPASPTDYPCAAPSSTAYRSPTATLCRPPTSPPGSPSTPSSTGCATI